MASLVEVTPPPQDRLSTSPIEIGDDVIDIDLNCPNGVSNSQATVESCFEDEVTARTMINSEDRDEVICGEDSVQNSERFHLRWSRISKVVEVKESSDGLLKSSISVHKKKQKGPKSKRPSLVSLSSLSLENNSFPAKAADPSSSSKVILNEVSGTAAAGEVLALMGPSGSGKTSLLDAISGRSSFDSGSLTINGVDLSEHKMKQLKRKIAYIKQNDIFFNHLSVRDQFTYIALLRLPSDWTKERKHSEVDRILNLLRLDKCADTPIRLISGGERKRVNIGTELLTNPSIIILDEPTSGLDSTSANALLKMITLLAKKFGKTVITSIHQPSSAVFQSFDKLLFLADGCVVYYGSPEQSLTYLENKDYPCPTAYNAADHWMDLLVVDSLLGNGGSLHNRSSNSLSRQEISKLTDSSSTDMESGEKPILVDSASNAEAERPNLNRNFSSQYKSTRRRNHVALLLRQSRLDAESSSMPRSRLIHAWDNDEFSNEIDRENEMILQSSGQGSNQFEDIFENERKFNSTWFEQYKILTHRSLKNSRSAIFTTLNLLKSFCLGFVSGFMWFQMSYTEETVNDRSSYLFFSVTYWVFDSIFASLNSFPGEQKVIAKERASGSYHFSAYFMAKTTSELPVRLTLPSIYMTISFWLSAANNSFWVFLGCACCPLMGCMAGESIGLLICSLIMVPEKSMVVALLFALTLMISGGYYVDNIPSFMSWIPFISPFKYAYDASLQLVFDRDMPCDGSGDLEIICKGTDTSHASREDVLEYLNVQGGVGFNIGLLFVLFIVPRYLAYLVLKNKKSKERS